MTNDKQQITNDKQKTTNSKWKTEKEMKTKTKNEKPKIKQTNNQFFFQPKSKSMREERGGEGENIPLRVMTFRQFFFKNLNILVCWISGRILSWLTLTCFLPCML